MHNWNYEYNKFAFETLSDTLPLEAANKTSSSGNNSSSLFKNLFTWSDLILKILYPFNEQIKPMLAVSSHLPEVILLLVCD